MSDYYYKPIDDAGKDYQDPQPPTAGWLVYLKSKEFWYSWAALLGIVLVLMVIFFYILLPLITNHGEEVEVPTVAVLEGKKYLLYKDAEKKIQGVGLTPVIGDSVYSPDLPHYAVIKQDPAPKSLVKPGRKIYLTVAGRTPTMIKMPDIWNDGKGTIQNAIPLLENWQLRVGNIHYNYGNVPDLVIAAYFKGDTLSPGKLVPRGAKIDLEVTSGPGVKKVPLPNLLDKSLQEGISILNRLNLGVGSVKRQSKPDAKEPNIIISQTPRFGSRDSVFEGTTVELIVTE